MLTFRTSRKDLSVSERIAALQRGSSPQPQGTRPTSPPGTPPKLPVIHSLKDKIAHFDSLGSAPKPSGSFGLGAPVEHKTTSRELYGNRIPGVAHKTGRSVSSSQAFSQRSNSSTSSLDQDALPRDSGHSRPSSNHSAEAPDGNTIELSPTHDSQASHKTEATKTVPEIRRTDSMTEHWVDAHQSNPGLSVETISAESLSVLAPPSPVPDSDDTLASGGPTTPLTRTLVRHLGASSHVPSRLGSETPVSIMVETGSLVDGEQPQFVSEGPGPVPSSPVVTGMQLLGLSDNGHAEGETTPTREDSEMGEAVPAAKPSTSSPTSTSLAPPNPAEEAPTTPLARSVNVGGPVDSVTLGDGQPALLTGLGISTGGKDASHGDELTTRNILELNAQSSLAPGLVAPSGPSSIIVESGSVDRSLQSSPNPQLQPGAHTPEPPSAITPKQGISELPILPPGILPLSAATLQLLDVDGGKKGGRSGTETPMSILVETGSTDEKPRDLEGVDPPIATPAPASPAASYFEEPRSDMVAQAGRDGSDILKGSTSPVNTANSELDNCT
jgi:hypothetical protein